MKKYIQGVISELKQIYPNRKIKIVNGFIGCEPDAEGLSLLHSTYIGNAFYEIDGIIYTDYNCNGDHKKLMKI